MKILLTGGNGFIGQSILRSPLGQAHTWLAPTRFELDLLDQLSVEMYIKFHKPDIIVHAATLHNVPEAVVQNTRMFLNLTRMSAHYKHLFNLSSGAVYDRTKNLNAISEDMLGLNIPTDPYGYSKYLMSLITPENATHLYLFGIYGPGEWESRFFTHSLLRILGNEPPVIYQDRLMSFLWIGDFLTILEGFLLAAMEGRRLDYDYNVAPSHAYLLSGLGRLMLKHMVGRNYRDIIVGTKGNAPAYAGDNRKMLALFRKAELDIRFTPPEETIPIMLEELRQALYVQEGR